MTTQISQTKHLLRLKQPATHKIETKGYEHISSFGCRFAVYVMYMSRHMCINDAELLSHPFHSSNIYFISFRLIISYKPLLVGIYIFVFIFVMTIKILQYD